LSEKYGGREINVFDFDDTLVKTRSHVYLTTSDGRHVKLTPAQYAVYEEQPGDVFDFSDFQAVTDPSPISHMLLKLKYAIQSLGLQNVFVLTARSAGEPISKFLEAIGIEGIRIVALGNSDPEAKADVIRDEVMRRKIDIVKFYDDSIKNVQAVRRLKHELPKVRIMSVHVK
jgi:FMN phosphatase YigB (HAD superfamily)